MRKLKVYELARHVKTYSDDDEYKIAALLPRPAEKIEDTYSDEELKDVSTVDLKAELNRLLDLREISGISHDYKVLFASCGKIEKEYLSRLEYVGLITDRDRLKELFDTVDKSDRRKKDTFEQAYCTWGNLDAYCDPETKEAHYEFKPINHKYTVEINKVDEYDILDKGNNLQKLIDALDVTGYERDKSYENEKRVRVWIKRVGLRNEYIQITK